MNKKGSLSLSLIALTAIAALMIANTGEGGLAGFFTRQDQPWSFIQWISHKGAKPRSG